jgi:hypothetical protein
LQYLKNCTTKAFTSISILISLCYESLQLMHSTFWRRPVMNCLNKRGASSPYHTGNEVSNASDAISNTTGAGGAFELFLAST